MLLHNIKHQFAMCNHVPGGAPCPEVPGRDLCAYRFRWRHRGRIIVAGMGVSLRPSGRARHGHEGQRGRAVSEKIKRGHSASRTDTILGVGVRVEGTVVFSGVLRNQGEIVGDISSADDPAGTLVIGKSGKVVGTIRTAHVVVGGRIEGNVDAAGSVEVQDGASVVGDIGYESIVVDAGGCIDGVLRSRPATAGEHLATRQIPANEVEVPPVVHSEPAYVASPEAATVRRKPAWRRPLVIVLLAVVVGSFVLAGRNPVESRDAATDATAGSAVEASTQFAEAKPVPSPVAEPPAVQEAVQPPPEPVPVEAPAKPSPAAVPATPAPTGEIAVVRGDSPGKPADFLYVICNEPCALVRKKHDATGEGTRIELPEGATKRVAIARNEVLRVAKGQDVDMFFQGRKVGLHTIRSGTWMSFVPHGSDK